MTDMLDGRDVDLAMTRMSKQAALLQIVLGLRPIAILQ